MRWPDALLHLVRRDIRQHKWVVSLFALAVLASALATFAPTGFQLVSLGTFLLADVLVALVVLEHHPARVDQLRAGLPIDRSVTLVNVAVVALGIPFVLALVGQAGLFAFLDVPLPSAGSMLLHGGKAFFNSLLVAVAIALVAGSLRFFLVGLVLWWLLGTVIGTALWYFVQQGQSFQVSVQQPITLVGVVRGLATIVMLAIPMLAFARRSMTTAMKWVTIGSIVALQVTNMLRGPFVPPIASLPPVGVGPMPVITMRELPADIPGLQTFTLSASGHLPGSRVVFRPDTVTFHDDGGQVVAAGIALDRRPIQLAIPRLTAMQGLSVIEGPDSAERTIVRIRPYGPLPAGVARVVLGGHVEVFSPESTVVRIPLRPHAFATNQGRLTIVDSVSEGSASNPIRLRRATVWSTFSLELLARPVTYALVHPGRSEFAWVSPLATDFTQSSSILPGISSTVEHVTLTTGPSAGVLDDRLGSSAELSPEWLREAQLAVVSWNSIGSARVEITFTWPRDSRPQPVATAKSP